MGSLVRPHYTTIDTKTGKRVKRRSTKWYVQIKNAQGKWVRESAYVDKELSRKKLIRRETEVAEEIELGPYVLAARKPLTLVDEDPAKQGHAEDFRDDMRNRGLKITHWRTTYNRLIWVLEKGEIKAFSDLVPANVNKALAKLVGSGKSVGSRNGYLTAVKSFGSWLKENSRVRENPFSSLSKDSTEGFETFVRRPLTEQEFSALFQYVEHAPPFDDISGLDRAALYATAAYTGFRRTELSTVLPESFTLDAEPRLTVVAGKSKRKKKEIIPLHESVAAYLAKWLKGRPKGVPLWPIGDKRTAEMIRADLLAIGIEAYVPGLPGDPPTVIDFHSLRGTFISRLASAGVAPKLAQELARHSSVDLTMNVYAKMTTDQRIAAVAILPSLAQGLAQPLHKTRPHDAVLGRKSPQEQSAKSNGQQGSKGRQKPKKKARDS